MMPRVHPDSAFRQAASLSREDGRPGGSPPMGLKSQPPWPRAFCRDRLDRRLASTTIGTGPHTEMATATMPHTLCRTLLARPIGSDGWHESIAHQQRHGASGKTPYSVEDLKDRVRTAIPFIAGRLQAWNQGHGAPTYWAGTLKFGASAAERNSIYSSAWHQLSPDRGRYWFQAASMVTGRGGIKDMEGWAIQNLASGLLKIDLSFVKASDLQFVIAGNQFLYPYNLQFFLPAGSA